jgi:hypothetical protein
VSAPRTMRAVVLREPGPVEAHADIDANAVAGKVVGLTASGSRP